MLMSPKPSDVIVQRVQEGEGDEFEFDLDKLRAVALRQARVFFVACLLGLAGGVLYILTAVPLYTATTQILLDNESGRQFDQLFGAAAVGQDNAAVDSEVEVVRSQRMAEAVVRDLNLTQDPTFMAERSSLLGAVTGAIRSMLDVSSWFGTPEVTVDPNAQERLERAALDRLRSGLEVRRLGRTYVLEVSYTATSPGEASRLANAYAQAYLAEQLDAKYDATRRASGWLQERIDELRQQSLAADLAVQRFRSENGLVAGSGGVLVNDQQLSEINSALVVARADTARAQARVERIRSIMAAGQGEALISDALDLPIITDLRASYLDASRRAEDLTERLGPQHIQVISLQNQMRQYERLIFEELGRIAESLESEYQVAVTRERSLQESLEASIGISAATNETLVQLRELERDAETLRTLYENFLTRFRESVQEQSFPITDARVITRAAPPEGASFPRKGLTLALALVLGSAAGVGLGMLREYSDRVFRTGVQVRDELDAEFLGMLPILAGKEDKTDAAASAEELAARREFRSPPLMRYVLEAPLSGYSETLRSVKVASDVALSEEKTRVVGFVSLLPGEGKSTTAKNFATLLAQQGVRTLLIDGDMRNPSLTRTLAPKARAGLLEALLQGVPLADLVLHETATDLWFLPAVIRSRISHTSDLLASAAMKALLREAAKSYDYVVVDLPPLGPVVDVRAAATQFSAFVFVVEWGKTARKAIRTTLRTEPRVAERCLGVVLNKVDTEQLQAYESYESKDFYYGQYSAYYRK